MTGEVRPYHVDVRLSRAERDQLVQAAEREKRSAAGYIRWLIARDAGRYDRETARPDAA